MPLDIISSLDSVTTTVGPSDHLLIMVVVVATVVGVTIFAVWPIGDFVDRHLSVKMLALSLLIFVGLTLMLESPDVHVSGGHIYSVMFFSTTARSLNLLRDKKSPL